MNQRYAFAFALALPLGLTAQTSNYPIGSTVADFTITDTHGETYNLYALTAAGKHVILDFFFYGCGPCQINAPAYSQLHETYGCNDGDLICISVNNGDDTDAIAEQFGVDFGGNYSHPPTIGQVQGGALTSTFGVSYFPTACIIGTDNKIKDDDIWPINNNMASFVAAFPPGSNIQPMACAVGIGEHVARFSTTVYPSPSTGQVYLDLALEQATEVQVTVTDGLGQVVLTNNLGRMTAGATVRTLDLNAMADGAYLLRITTGNSGIINQRIILAR
ncbi:MAG TPA: T9SS type A sorting domain-containing protein [Flavobacteriales bacterium]|jgi:peroxiredoxin|nr:T9SS type A sorting domain-containing protein [Flavobacteriales bacterium]MBK6550994.1 T9SS type A sorting domain-containing protein [Flavobacteriales bacterium]MBK7101231.1 T9SS type A sorting domain-containing protein [Flavobacteriales bacterium]MBK7111939.1 T9SS type A sorting domain-containing protein [Flavobacteriales bacterium]MBK7482059.1 T9SS type A sorting domain-containing protein [Flavobacteriales bacterium]